ncbi:MAG: FMN-binding protein [Firmicutes bacterium]|nr:FMN-binding protein [Bacillota bacterium]
MNNLLIKIICVFLVLLAFAEYNSVTATRIADETVAKAEAEAAAVQTGAGDSAGSAGGGYKDGTYVGSAQGYGGTVSVEVTIEGGSITNIEAIAHGGEDAAYWDMCSGVIPQLIETQGAQADTVSGATFSSTGIINATIDALSQAL